MLEDWGSSSFLKKTDALVTLSNTVGRNQLNISKRVANAWAGKSMFSTTLRFHTLQRIRICWRLSTSRNNLLSFTSFEQACFLIVQQTINNTEMVTAEEKDENRLWLSYWGKSLLPETNYWCLYLLQSSGLHSRGNKTPVLWLKKRR